MLAITLDTEIEQRLEALGTTTADAKMAFVREALREALEDLEDVRLAEERLAKPEKEYSLDEAERFLGLDRQVA